MGNQPREWNGMNDGINFIEMNEVIIENNIRH